MWAGVAPGDDPQHVHVVLVDDGRTDVLAEGASAARHPPLNVPQPLPGLRAGWRARPRLGLPGTGRRGARVEDCRAVVDRVHEADLGAAVAGALATHGATSAVAPNGLDPGRFELPVSPCHRVTVSPQDEVTDHGRPDAAVLAGVVITADVGIAVTGTIVLAHGLGQGPGALTLVPDLHVCVVRAEQVVADVPEATARLADSVPAGRAEPGGVPHPSVCGLMPEYRCQPDARLNHASGERLRRRGRRSRRCSRRSCTSHRCTARGSCRTCTASRRRPRRA